MNPDVIVAGGGFFGCMIALMLREKGHHPLVVEAEGRLLERASRVNQARVHGGYHYPRSLVTAYRSRHNYNRFREVFREAIVDDFEKVYAIARRHSKVNAAQFELFMKRIGAPLRPAPERITAFFNPDLTERVWLAEECAFDCSILRDICISRLEDAGIPVLLGIRVASVTQVPGGVEVMLSDGRRQAASLVVNATYSGLNLLGRSSSLNPIPLKHELAEMALIQLPPALEDIGVTFMCGPFFSFMPYPSRNLSSISHVRFTPHGAWHERDFSVTDPYLRFSQTRKSSHYPYMIADATRYIPALKNATYVDSIWEVKTLLPQTEIDDSRPILFRRDPSLPRIIHVMGGKIDNIFDVEDELDRILGMN
ncbi:MAG: FAD-binding oxidoreductase [Akkermansiaceae bacterium]|nr:FAD-binding oxidoreductase [Akkermansiaceae bacterium]